MWKNAKFWLWVQSAVTKKGAFNMANNIGILKYFKNETITWPSNPALVKNQYLGMYHTMLMFTGWLSTITEMWEKKTLNVDPIMKKKVNVVQRHSKILFNMKKRNSSKCDNMDEPWGPYSEWNENCEDI